MKVKNRFYLIFIALSVLVSFYFLVLRHKAESQYKGYEIVADYDDFANLAYAENKSVEEYFKELKENGVTTVAVNELTINSMKKEPSSSMTTELKGNDLVIKNANEIEKNLILEGLKNLKESREVEVSNISNELVIKGIPSDMVVVKQEAMDLLQNKLDDKGKKTSILEYISLGFDKNKIDKIKSVEGLNINLRPTFNSDFQDSEKSINQYIKSVNEYSKNQNFIIFNGKDFYKFNQEDNKFKDFLIENNIALGLIEASNQRGHLALNGVDGFIKREEVPKIRAFTTWDYLQSHYDYKIPFHHNGEELSNIYYRAISERNIAVIFLKPFVKDNKFITSPEKYGYVLKDLENRLESKGYKSGEVNPIGHFTPNAKLKTVVGFGTVAGAVLLLNLIFNLNSIVSMGLFILGMLLSLIFFGLSKAESLGNILFNLASIVVFPSLSVLFIVENYNKIKSSRKVRSISISKIFFHGAITLFIGILITFVGVLMEVSFMSGTNYLLELVIFRGVKISQLLPILIAFIIYVKFVYLKDNEVDNKSIVGILNSNVKIWHGIVVAFGLCVLAIFILRGGNSSTEVPKMELLLRNIFEKFLYARPRTKALFAGFPSVVLLSYIGYKNWARVLDIVFILFISIGMADIVNTFSHIRTPLVMSFSRVGIEYVGALILSFVGIVIVDLIRKGTKKLIG